MLAYIITPVNIKAVIFDACILVQHTTGTAAANTVNSRQTGYSISELVSPDDASHPISIVVMPGVITLLSICVPASEAL